jgi:hypothetical protein
MTSTAERYRRAIALIGFDQRYQFTENFADVARLISSTTIATVIRALPGSVHSS